MRWRRGGDANVVAVAREVGVHERGDRPEVGAGDRIEPAWMLRSGVTKADLLHHPARDRNRMGDMLQRRHVDAALHAVALNIGVDDKGRAVFKQAGQGSVYGQACIGHPATGFELAAFGIKRNCQS